MNVEQQEAKKALEGLAREIHGIYGQHAAEAGLKAPAWEDLPDQAKAVSRDMARLVIAKMQEAFAEGQKVKPEPAPLPAPKVTGEEVAKGIKTLLPEIDTIISRIERMKHESGPLSKGMNDAIHDVSRETALELLKTDEELKSAVRQIVEDGLHDFLLGKEDDNHKGQA